jgi:hypothetical protein
MGDRLWWRIAKGTSKGTVRGIAVGTPKAVNGVKAAHAKFKDGRTFATAFDDEYVPDSGEIPPRKFSWKSTFTCCGRRYKTVEHLNRHHLAEHDGESPEVAARALPTLHISKTAKTLDKRTVTPVANTPTGRHRPSSSKPKATSVADLVAKHRAKITEIGKKAVMDNESARLVHNGFLSLDAERPGPLSHIEATALGFEQAFAVGSESIANYRRKLIQAGFDPAHLQHYTRAQADLESAATHMSSAIATIKDEMRSDIAAAKARLNGEKPNDKTLAN